jgi:heme-degrading monooxygenase HmoA
VIARVWRGVAAPGETADAYFAFLTGKVLPSLAGIAGHRGAQVVQRAAEGGTEFVVTTYWDSMEAVRAFAGERPERAVVEPDARAVLTDFDDAVSHFEVTYDARIATP